LRALKAGRTTFAKRLLCELIATPSVNPAFAPADRGGIGELAVAEFLGGFAKAAGLPVELHEVLPKRPNLIIRLAPQGRVRQRVLLAPHLDTIGEPGSWPELVSPIEKHGRVYGRGACDTKGSVAAMLTALLRLAKSGSRPQHTEVVFAGLADEENAQTGSRALVGSGFRADLAIVGEPTGLRIVTAHKGDTWLRLETHGKAAHGARPELGVNAVHQMAKVVDLLETQYAAKLKERTHPLLGHATVNVGSIHGGTQPNVVPAHCWITVDRRTLPGESEATVRAEIKALLRQQGMRAALGSARNGPCVSLDTDTELPLVKRFLALAGQKGPAGVDFFCDAAILAQGGIPSVVVGPGDIVQAHTAKEWISMRSLEAAVKILERFLRSLP
jgi:acetylornithine deacetylase/succinyl-diaminopimelate desuccinylase-like protein